MKNSLRLHQRYRRLEKRIIIFIAIITGILLLFPKQVLLIKQEYSASYVLLIYMALSVLFLILNRRRLIIAMFGATGVIALFLKVTLDSHVEFAPSNHTEQLDIQMVHLDQLSGDEKEMTSYIHALDGDLVFFHGLTPDWNDRLTSVVVDNNSQLFSLERIDLFGLGLLAHRNVTSIDTIEFEGIPVLRTNLLLNDFDELRIIQFLLPPGLTHNSKIIQKKFIDKLVSVHGNEKATLFVGDFNLTPWSDNLQYLKYKTNTKCSRVNKSRLNVIQENPFDYYPTAHILYNRKLQNTFFSEMEFNSSLCGVMASYQIKK